jgi:hypothetical protein
MREIRLSGSVRGADREVRPYRDLHFSGSILSVAFAVFHFAFEGAEQSYTSLPGCPIASKFRMQAKCA